MARRLQVIINPGAGQAKPVLQIMNSIFKPAGIKWDISITHEVGDGKLLAQAAVAAGVDLVAACGGDGTVAEVASGLIGSDVPLAILPGGTANVMAVELDIPTDFIEACNLLTRDDYTLLPVDMGYTGTHHFLLRIGLGLEAAMVEGASPDLKFQMGSLAYGLSVLQALQDPIIANYELTLDDRVVQSEGVTCLIANSGNLGARNSTLAPGIDVSDGLLDVLVIRKVDLSTLLALATSVVTGQETKALQRWQARKIAVVADPVQTVQADGEIIGKSPVRAEVISQAIRIVVPGELG